MRRKTLFSAIIACLGLLLLSACSSIPVVGLGGTATPTGTGIPVTQPSATSADSLEKIDWSNYTYTFSCYTGSPVQVTMKNGEADQNNVHYTVEKPVFGDLNGDGQPEAVIIYHCEGGGTSPYLAYVYTGTASHPTLLAYLPRFDKGDKIVTIKQAVIAQGVLQLVGYAYSANVPECCPDLLATTTYKWTGSELVVVNSTAIPRPPNT